MENVRTGRVALACISATTVDESIPPDRNAPSGTSATMRRLIASLSRSSSSSAAASSVSDNRGDCASRMTSSRDQNALMAGAAPDFATSICPGGNFSTP